MSKITDIEGIEISSWAAPTAEDTAILESLSDEQYRALLEREIERGFSSGLADRSGKDVVWQEALRRVKSRTRTPDAL